MGTCLLQKQSQRQVPKKMCQMFGESFSRSVVVIIWHAYEIENVGVF